MTESTWLRGADPDKMLECLQGKISQRQMWLFGCSCCRRVWNRLSDKGRNLIEATETLADGGMGHRKFRRIWEGANHDEAGMVNTDFVVLFSQLGAINRRINYLQKRLSNDEISNEEYVRLWRTAYREGGAVCVQDPHYPSAAARQVAGDVARMVYLASTINDNAGRLDAQGTLGGSMGASALLSCTPWAMVIRARWHDAGGDLSKVEGNEKRFQAKVLWDIFGNPFSPLTALASSLLTPDVLALANIAYAERKLPEGTLDPAHLAALADALSAAGCTDASLLAHLRSPGNHGRGCHALDKILGRN